MSTCLPRESRDRPAVPLRYTHCSPSPNPPGDPGSWAKTQAKQGLRPLVGRAQDPIKTFQQDPGGRGTMPKA